MERFENRIICGDCVEILNRIEEPFADLIFADPPFNIGYEYDEYDDKVKDEHYLDWTERWIKTCKRVLKDHGSFYIAIGDEYAANIRLIAENTGFFLRNWIIWHYTFGQQNKRCYARAHTHIFYFVKNKENYVFNDYAVRVPSGRQLIYNDKRANPAGKMPDDVWNRYSRVCGTFNERVGWHPCQMPQSILMRIIALSSNEGDMVFDPFCGSGTTPAAALQMNRKYSAIELSTKYAQKARERLKEIQEQKQRRGSDNGCNPVEVKRLLIDMGMSQTKILESRKLLSVFTNQLNVRVNNGKKYSSEFVAGTLGELNA